MRSSDPKSQHRKPEDHRIKSKIWIEPEMFYSDAFHTLSASAIKTLLRCLQKRKWEKRRHRIFYSDEPFIFPYFEAEELKIARGTQHFCNIKRLVELGFISIVHQGGRYQQTDDKDYSVYRLTDGWKRWKKGDVPVASKPKVLDPVFYVQAQIHRKNAKPCSETRSSHVRKREVGPQGMPQCCLRDPEDGEGTVGR
jgi:hypothetical protein